MSKAPNPFDPITYPYREAEQAVMGASLIGEMAKDIGSDFIHATRKEKIEYAGYTLGSLVLAGTVIGGAIGIHEMIPSHHEPVPISKVGGHSGQESHSTQPGMGILHTEGHNFHVTQNP